MDTREAWLNEAAQLLQVAFDLPVPTSDLQVSCGYGPRSKAIGCCIAPEASNDGRTEIFISPVIEESTKALGVLLHELIHAGVGVQAGHGPLFKRVATRVGFLAPITKWNPTPELLDNLAALAKDLPDYPHAAINLNAIKKGGNRWIKVVCPDERCGFTCNMSRKQIERLHDQSACPVCTQHTLKPAS